MGVTVRTAGTLLFLLVPLASAAPALRLTNTVVGPVSIAQGAGGPQQTIEAYNAGDGTLALSFSSTVPWATATADSPRACSNRDTTCIPIRIALQTQSLAAGVYTGTITVRDPNAIDAPQDILVSAQVGGGIPANLNFYVAPNGSIDETVLSTNSQIQTSANTTTGGNWLSIALEGLGSFRFVLPYRVKATHQAGMAEGTYNGTIGIAGSQFAADNKNVNVTLRVTSQPIAALGSTDIRFRAAQNTKTQTSFLSIANRGLGTLTVSSTAVATASGGAWLAADPVKGVANLYAVTAAPGSLAPGSYTGTVTVTSNAINSPQVVPVTLEVVAPSGPVVAFQGVANNANFDGSEPVALGGIAAIFGQQLSNADPTSAPSLPLGSSLGGATVFLNDRPVPVFYTSYNQINFQVPYDAATGDALLRVDRDGQRGNSVSVKIVTSSPRFLKLTGDFAIAQNQDFSLLAPTRLGFPGARPAKIGEAIVLYALGLGPVDPAVAAGAAAPSAALAKVKTNSARVMFGAAGIAQGIPADAFFVGLTPGFAGLYQINVFVPAGVAPGDVPVRLQMDTTATDTAFIAVQ